MVGRSLGSAIAAELAAYACSHLGKNPAALVLISAFESLKSIVRHIAGRVIAFFLRDRLRTIEVIKLVTCPTLIIHGRKDEVVPWQHGHSIFRNAAGPASLMLSDEMTHDSFDFV